MHILDNFISWKDAKKLFEEKQTYEYGCAMLYFEMPQMKELHESIDPNDVYTQEGDRSFGLETNPHVTLLYGLHHDVDHDAVMNTCQSRQYPQLTLKNASCFNNSDYDVLKFDVDSPELHQVNQELTKFPHTTNFPDYHPHSTVAYLNKGAGQKYIDALQGKEFTVTPNKIVYSLASGDKVEKSL
jgi:2'-5' RNA ligase